MNTVILTGRITKDIEIRRTPNNNAVTTFSLAVTRDKENTDFIVCNAWNKTAELLEQYCKKGSKIGVTGAIRTHSWEENGLKRYATDVLVNSVEFLDNKSESTTAETNPTLNIESDDLPF